MHHLRHEQAVEKIPQQGRALQPHNGIPTTHVCHLHTCMPFAHRCISAKVIIWAHLVNEL